MGTRVYLWPIHFDVWQKPSQYCKIIILQLKKKPFLLTQIPLRTSPERNTSKAMALTFYSTKFRIFKL